MVAFIPIIIIGLIIAIVGALVMSWAIHAVIKWGIIFFVFKMLMDQNKKEDKDIMVILLLIGVILTVWKVMGVVPI